MARPHTRIDAPRPTITGIQSGGDEVLENATRQILGPDIDESVVIEMAR